MREQYKQYVALNNKAAQANGFEGLNNLEDSRNCGNNFSS